MRVGVGAAVVLVLVGVGVAVVAAMLAPRGDTVVLDPSVVTTHAPTTILVHVLGAVSQPGLYELTEGSRVVDAVAAAGGFRADADATAINLARVVTDAEQVRVPAVGEVVAQIDDGLVNLNTAEAGELQSLPRIGPALAARIVAWRESNGSFRSVEDLLAVSGIGAKTLDALRSLVTV